MTAAAVAAPSLQAQSGSKRLPIRKAVLLGMLPKSLTIADKFALAKDCGFEAMECGTEDNQATAEEIKAASDKVKLPIHSVMNRDHWQYPLSSPDPTVVAKSVKGMETSIANAKLWGAQTVLLVPAVVNPEVSYKQAWDRSTAEIKKMIPLAAKSKVIIAIEEVWNKFLLSPIEFANYVDQFKSPWVKAYFDVGNVVLYGYPQDWIRTLGPRIAKLHLKDFKFAKRQAEFVNLRDGEINWKEIYKALEEIGYKGDATVELSGGDADYLKDVSKRVDMILESA
ncbi:sugar phosphate isomerase/epimerase [Paludibaculum fermentans]|uniref:Sugar phosphate isomerase/epimerase n=2 Tax=Paludibaculum fermentans TaxID=1473598 RepID=A0A7S7NYI9_PALFE|nr:sugar phosphate isomerase/epimerase [Paludibaculum fermentans]